MIPGVSSDAYKLDWVNGKFSWLQPLPYDSVSLTYRVFPYKLNAAFSTACFRINLMPLSAE
jgi:hypothetical protein